METKIIIDSISTQTILDLTQISICQLETLPEVKTCQKNLAIDCIIVDPSPISKEQLEAICSAEKTFNELKDDSDKLLGLCFFILERIL